jgi:hypothetical protein
LSLVTCLSTRRASAVAFRVVLLDDHLIVAKEREGSPRDPGGGGPKGGVPFTVYFPADEGYRAADLAQPAALPHVGDTLEYIDEAGIGHSYRVTAVVHTLQATPSVRPHVRDSASPAGLARPNQGPQSVPESPELTSGLPKVFVEALPEE